MTLQGKRGKLEGPKNVRDLWANSTFFPGGHMNKRTWYTILFDSGLDFEELCARLVQSRKLALR